MKEVKRYIERCDQCQKIKNRTEMSVRKLRLNAVPEKPWQYMSVDFVMKLPVSSGYNLILVVCDRFSKILHFIMITEKIIAKELAKLFRDDVWKLHGLLKSVISDRRPQFAVGLIKELKKMLGIETKLLMAFHLQIDRQKERTNQELEQYLRIYINHKQNN